MYALSLVHIPVSRITHKNKSCHTSILHSEIADLESSPKFVSTHPDNCPSRCIASECVLQCMLQYVLQRVFLCAFGHTTPSGVNSDWKPMEVCTIDQSRSGVGCSRKLQGVAVCCSVLWSRSGVGYTATPALAGCAGSVCVCVCARARVCVRVCVCVSLCVCEGILPSGTEFCCTMVSL